MCKTEVNTVVKSVKHGTKSKKPQKYMFIPTISAVQRRRKLRDNLEKLIKKYEDGPKEKITDPEKEEDKNLELLLLAIDSICRCRGLVDEILRPRPEITDLVPLRNFKYVLFEKAIGFVEEFNSIMRVLVKKILKVDIADAFSNNDRLLNSNLISCMLEFI